MFFDEATKSGLQALTMMANGKIELNSQQAKMYAEVLADLEVFEVLRLIANRWGSKGLVRSTALALAESKWFLSFVRARGDFKTSLIAFASEQIFDLALKEQFVDVALRTEAAMSANDPFAERPSLIERLQNTSIPFF
ncbi:hypothetical protein GQ56_0131850 [Burkholderia paludis]|nr:hypothetical protein GQ56_0131850 [Burkholderia paludis]